MPDRPAPALAEMPRPIPAKILENLGLDPSAAVKKIDHGHIQETFRVEGPGGPVIVQKMPGRFSPEQGGRVAATLSFLKKSGVPTGEILPVGDGTHGTVDADGHLWRAVEFVPGETIFRFDRPEQAAAAAHLTVRVEAAAGDFRGDLPGDLETDFSPAHHVLEFFQTLRGRLENGGENFSTALPESIEALGANPAAARELLEICQRRRDTIDGTPDLERTDADRREGILLELVLCVLEDEGWREIADNSREKSLPRRAIWEEPIARNFRVDEAGIPAAVIDLNSLKHGAITWDWGQIIRSVCKADRPDGRFPEFRIDFFEAAVEAYFAEAKSWLSRAEAAAIVPEALRFVRWVVVRFAMDAIEASHYFLRRSAHIPGDFETIEARNLHLAAAEFSLLRDLEGAEAEMAQIVSAAADRHLGAA